MKVLDSDNGEMAAKNLPFFPLEYFLCRNNEVKQSIAEFPR